MKGGIEMLKKMVKIRVLKGQKHLPKQFLDGDVYAMTEVGDGIVQIKKEQFYLLSVSEDEEKAVSVANMATGAIIGGVLTGGVGAVVGLALGSGQVKQNIFYMTLMNRKTEEKFVIEVKIAKGQIKRFMKFKLAGE